MEAQMELIEKAIERLTQIERFSNYPFMPGDREALRLGIEALKREQILRHEVPYDRDGLLPGETKD